MAASSSSKSVESERWVIIYPAYLNSTKTIPQGRKIPKEKAVENPTVTEIMLCVKKLGFACVEEDEKCYSRDPVVEVGRVRVELKRDKTIVNPEIPNRLALYKKVAELIPQLATRVKESAKKAGKQQGKKK